MYLVSLNIITELNCPIILLSTPMCRSLEKRKRALQGGVPVGAQYQFGYIYLMPFGPCGPIILLSTPMCRALEKRKRALQRDKALANTKENAIRET